MKHVVYGRCRERKLFLNFTFFILNFHAIVNGLCSYLHILICSGGGLPEYQSNSPTEFPTFNPASTNLPSTLPTDSKSLLKGGATKVGSDKTFGFKQMLSIFFSLIFFIIL